MKKLLFFGVLCLFLLTTAIAQPSAVMFEPESISDGGVFGFTLSPDLQTALWVKSKGKRDTLKIMESKKIGGKWSAPVVASFSTSDGTWKDIDPIFSPDGKMVLFQSNRPMKEFPDRKGFDIWAVIKTGDGWGQPYHLGNDINTDESESYASMSENGNIYFMKDKENEAGNSDLFVSEYINGRYQKPKNVGGPINTSFRESNPYVSPKEDYIIYFSSDSSGMGEVDLYISFKNKGSWSTPKNLGSTINSNVAEFCPFVHQKEKRLYFSRQVKESDRMIENIYHVPFEVKDYK